MNAAWFQQHVVQEGVEIRSVRIEQGSIRRGKHSIVARIMVETTTKGTKHLFLKRYVKEELPTRSPRQWRRDLTSYRSEARFYANVYPLLMHPCHLRLIKPIDVRFRLDAQGAETNDGFIVLLENVLCESPTDAPTRLVPKDSLSYEDTCHALDYLAVLHASAIRTPAIMAQVKADLWDSASWWTYHKRGDDELQNAPRVWAKVLAAFEPALTNAGVTITPHFRALADRMLAQAAYVNGQLVGPASDRFESLRTLVHGDFKTANLFFDAQTGQVTAFDWQWAGVGLGVLDIANLLNTSVGIDALGHERQLLRHYYDRFERERGGGVGELEATYPFEALVRHYELASIEYMRVLIANFWETTTLEACAGEDGANTNWGLGYRSVPHVIRAMRKLDDGLRAIEAEQVPTN